MELGMIGLGRMGATMARRLMKAGHRIVAFDAKPEPVKDLVAAGAIGADSLEELVAELGSPRSLWMMLPSGDVTEGTIQRLAGLLSPGDTLIDGGNSMYRDSQRRAATLEESGLHFIDVGTSGGIWGLSEGYSLMIGGEAAAVERHRPLFEALAPAPEKGWGHVGPNGAGHFAKMIHNGIEYGLMQAYAEGFEILKAKQEMGFSLHQVAEIWRHGSVVRSWLLDLTSRALVEDENLSQVKA